MTQDALLKRPVEVHIVAALVGTFDVEAGAERFRN